MRKVPIVTNQIYHIFNRGVNKANIFFSYRDYQRFMEAAIHYKTKTSKFSYELSSNQTKSDDPGSLNEKPRVEILSYCLMPNHFHFLITQLVDGGLTSFMQHLANSYVHYVNIKHKRTGPLFESRFKNVLIETDEQLLHVSRYIHLNPLVSDLISNLRDYNWSSCLSYITEYKDKLCNPKIVLDHFKSQIDYEKFVLDRADYGRTLEEIKHLIIDDL